MSSRQTVIAPDAPEAIGPYVHAVKTRGSLLFISGQIPLHPESGEVVGETPAEQAAQCLANLKAIVDASGATLEQAVKLSVYMTDISAFSQVNEVYADFFKDTSAPPARIAVGVAALPRGVQVEIDAIFTLEDAD